MRHDEAARWVVIVAAGASRRMGRSKADLPFNPFRGATGSFLDRLVDVARESCAPDRLIVVTRPGQAAPVEGVTRVVNERPERGMFSSVQVGLRAAVDGRGGVRSQTMVMLVDHPLVRRATVRRLWAVAEGRRNLGGVVVPVYAGQAGHPVVLGGEVVRAALAAPAEERLDRVIAGFVREEVGVGDPGVVRDLDTVERYEYFVGPLRG